MIGVLLEGRMGNQMFQFAFAYCVSKKLKTQFFTYDKNKLQYFMLYPDFEKHNRNNQFKFVIRNFLAPSAIGFIKPFYKINKEFVIKRGAHSNLVNWPNVTEGNEFLLTNFIDNKMYQGYFQCEDYFKAYRTDILNIFDLKEEFKTNFKEQKHYLLKEPYIAVHVRRSDYIEHGGEEIGGFNMTLPMTYYKNCIDKIGNSKMPVVFVSDDIDFVKKEFGTKKNYFFESNDEIIDFQILLNAQQIIIANSSFSWWAAWLNNKIDKVVYAPKYYLGFKIKKYYPAGIKVHNWNWIDVD